MAIRRRKIKAAVETLLNENGVTEAPVPVSKIAQRRGARIHAGALEGDLSGFFFRDRSQVVIGVNTSHAPARQNFTIAHELGHLMLHDDVRSHVDHEFRSVRLRNSVSSQGTDEAEQEANLFAATLLMPQEFIERDLASEKYANFADDDDFIREMARDYGVSLQALSIRLKALGYIQE
jgi:Zn-dependent peptidase ImmA (M78 family)